MHCTPQVRQNKKASCRKIKMTGGFAMSGQKGMKHFGDTIINEVLKLRSEGKTHSEIAEQFGLRNSIASKNLLKRYRQKVTKLSLGFSPRKKGRPSKKEESLSEENRRLKKQVEILTLFLQTRERR